MVFDKFKEDVVVEKGWASKKSIYKMTARLALLCLFVAIGLGLVTYYTVNMLVTLLVLILTGVGFVYIFDVADEDKESFDMVMKLSKFWWLAILLDIAVLFILKYFRFM